MYLGIAICVTLLLELSDFGDIWLTFDLDLIALRHRKIFSRIWSNSWSLTLVTCSTAHSFQAMSDYVQTDEQTGAWIFNWTVSVSIAGLSRLLVATLQFGGQELSSATGHLLVGPKTWNSLPSNTRNSPSVTVSKFKSVLKTYLFTV